MSDFLQSVEQLAMSLSPDERRELVERLTRSLHLPSPPRKRGDLYGVFRHALPQDIDLDKALREIRTQWHEDFENGGAAA